MVYKYGKTGSVGQQSQCHFVYRPNSVSPQTGGKKFIDSPASCGVARKSLTIAEFVFFVRADGGVIRSGRTGESAIHLLLSSKLVPLVLDFFFLVLVDNLAVDFAD